MSYIVAGQTTSLERRCKCGDVDTKYDDCGNPDSEPWCKDNGSTYCPIGIPANSLNKGQFCCNHDPCKEKLSCENDEDTKDLKNAKWPL